jgi:uncharacterized membrane protein HdeD (DUF308 family)
MTDVPSPENRDAAQSIGPQLPALEALKKNSGWFLVMGIILVLAGTAAVGSSFFATLATVMAFGIIILVGGVAQIISTLCCRKWGGFLLELLAGILYLIIGLLMINHPLQAAAGITLMVAAFLMVGGMFRIIVSVTERFESWGWILLNGVVTLLLGILLWRQWPLSGLWAIGIFVGIQMIFSGFSWIMLSMTVKRLGQELES